MKIVRDLVEGNHISPIILAIIDIARGFGLHLIAEGIETRYQMETLRNLGCDEMQVTFLIVRSLLRKLSIYF
jgi:EAL domain-containing protein (putative c-di-GMP-specific phosphodiesterase class I)